MMPLWLDIEDFADKESETGQGIFCPECLEPLDFCDCGYYPNDDEESEEENE